MTGVFIFSGTIEGKELAYALSSAGIKTTVRVATEYGAEVMEKRDNLTVHTGSCGGVSGIIDAIKDCGCNVVVDATHPYASVISSHVKEACVITGTKYIRIKRKESEGMTDIVHVPDVKSAVKYLNEHEGKILVTTGAKEISKYSEIKDYKNRVYARVLPSLDSVQKCFDAGLEGKNIFCGQGPFGEDFNYALIRQTGASYIVTKDSGPEGGYPEKLAAAEKAGITVVLIDRPDKDGISLKDAFEILEKKFKVKLKDYGRRKLHIIGIGMGFDTVTVKSIKAIKNADLIVGAKRMIASVPSEEKDILEEYKPKEIFEYLRNHPEYRNIAVLMSGDVGFYSGTKNLLSGEGISEFDVFIEPGLSSVQYLSSKAGISWQDTHLISAHGKSANVVNACHTHAKTFSLLSGDYSVNTLCDELIEYGLNDVEIIAGQELGTENEKIIKGTPETLKDMAFSSLSVVLILNDKCILSNPIGIDDSDFLRGDAPMTKSEIRSLSVIKLKLSPDSVVYDIGAGTGSVSVEMAKVAYDGKVYAIEKELPALDLIDKNRHIFKTPNIEIISGTAPAAMENLPAPTHAFIGGSSGNLKQIVQMLLDKNPDIRLVINAVTLETIAEITETIRDLNLVNEEITSVNISKSRKLGKYNLMTAQNPVYIAVVRGR